VGVHPVLTHAAEKLSLDDGHLLAGSDETPRQRWPDCSVPMTLAS
jgi:hypothetical protein